MKMESLSSPTANKVKSLGPKAYLNPYDSVHATVEDANVLFIWWIRMGSHYSQRLHPALILVINRDGIAPADDEWWVKQQK